jgi:hypothetical protein
VTPKPRPTQELRKEPDILSSPRQHDENTGAGGSAGRPPLVSAAADPADSIDARSTVIHLVVTIAHLRREEVVSLLRPR